MTAEQLTKSLKAEAKQLGFEIAGACPAVEPAGFPQLLLWLDTGHHGEMQYISERKQAYRHPEHVLDGAVSVLMLGMNYQTVEACQPNAGQGRVSRYAWGSGDYHDHIHTRLKQLVAAVREAIPDANVRGVVDTAPLLEREFGQLAGLGWQAKNTMLINRTIGSWFFLAALLLDVPLEYDQPFEANHCGSCRACIEACPTDAFVDEYVLDARRCISYLTIEHRSAIDVELRSRMGGWIFGCDVCQDVCPWNNKAATSSSDTFLPMNGRNPQELLELFQLDDQQFRDRFRATPLWRPRRRGLLRNAAIALGNKPDDGNVDALALGLGDTESLVRGTSAWALGSHRESLARPLLEQRLEVEVDDEVAEEIRYALARF